MSDEIQPGAADPTMAQSGDAPVGGAQGQEAPAPATEAAAPANTPQVEDRSWQSRYDRLQQEIGRDLQGYVKAFGGGNQIVGFLKQLETLVGNPTLGPIVQNFLKTGQVDLPKPKTNDWDEPVQEPEWKNPINSVLAEIQNLKQELNGFKQRQGMAAITDHTKRFMAEYPMSDDETAQFREYMDSQWGTLAANPNGASVLSNMDWDTYETLAMRGVKPFLDKIYGRRLQKTRSQNVQKATDAPAQTPVATEKRPNGAAPQSVEQLRQQVRAAFTRAMQG